MPAHSNRCGEGNDGPCAPFAAENPPSNISAAAPASKSHVPPCFESPAGAAGRRERLASALADAVVGALPRFDSAAAVPDSPRSADGDAEARSPGASSLESAADPFGVGETSLSFSSIAQQQQQQKKPPFALKHFHAISGASDDTLADPNVAHDDHDDDGDESDCLDPNNTSTMALQDCGELLSNRQQRRKHLMSLSTAALHEMSQSAFKLSTTAVADTDEEGALQEIDGITVLSQIGSGQYGTVHHGFSDDYDVELAVKCIPRGKVARNHSLSPSSGGGGGGHHQSPPPPPPLQHRAPALQPIATAVAEAEVLRDINHPNIVRLFQCIDTPEADEVYLVMEYIAGGACGTVETVMDRGTGAPTGEFAVEALAPRELAIVARDVAAALQHCEERQLVHGDIKPENILVRRDRGGRVQSAVLADFGVCAALHARKSQQPSPTTTSSAEFTPQKRSSSGVPKAVSFVVADVDVANDAADDSDDEERPATLGRRKESAEKMQTQGTPAFLAPELTLSGDQPPTTSSDMWATGVVLAGLTFGRLPFRGRNLSELTKSIQEDEPDFPLDPPPNFTAGLGERMSKEALRQLYGRWVVVLRLLLHKDPSQRLPVVVLSLTRVVSDLCGASFGSP